MKDTLDPKRLIAEAYRIDGITEPECRSIFLDWALGQPDGDPRSAIPALLARHDAPDHPMSKVLREAERDPPQAARRGGRAGRIGSGNTAGR